MTKQINILLFIILLISSCSENIHTNGLSNTTIKNLEVKLGFTTKDELNEKYGPPVFESIFNNNVIYYISHQSSFKNFKPRKTKDLLVIEITLDKKNKVKNVKKYTAANARNVLVSKETTNVLNNDGVFLKQILENLQKSNIKN